MSLVAPLIESSPGPETGQLASVGASAGMSSSTKMRIAYIIGAALLGVGAGLGAYFGGGLGNEYSISIGLGAVAGLMIPTAIYDACAKSKVVQQTQSEAPQEKHRLRWGVPDERSGLPLFNTKAWEDELTLRAKEKEENSLLEGDLKWQRRSNAVSGQIDSHNIDSSCSTLKKIAFIVAIVFLSAGAGLGAHFLFGLGTLPSVVIGVGTFTIGALIGGHLHYSAQAKALQKAKSREESAQLYAELQEVANKVLLPPERRVRDCVENSSLQVPENNESSVVRQRQRTPTLKQAASVEVVASAVLTTPSTITPPRKGVSSTGSVRSAQKRGSPDCGLQFGLHEGIKWTSEEQEEAKKLHSLLFANFDKRFSQCSRAGAIDPEKIPEKYGFIRQCLQVAKKSFFSITPWNLHQAVFQSMKWNHPDNKVPAAVMFEMRNYYLAKKPS